MIVVACCYKDDFLYRNSLSSEKLLRVCKRLQTEARHESMFYHKHAATGTFRQFKSMHNHVLEGSSQRSGLNQVENT